MAVARARLKSWAPTVLDWPDSWAPTVVWRGGPNTIVNAGWLLVEEVDPALTIVLDPEPPPLPPGRTAASWLAHSSWLKTEPRPLAAGARC